MRHAIVPPRLAQAAQATGFSPAIRAGDFLYLTGATGGDAQGVMPDDLVTQCRNALDKVLEILTHSGAGPNAVVEVTSYHTDIRTGFDQVQAAMEQTFGTPLPAWTAIGVANLRRPGALIEFRVVAHHPDASNDA